MYINMEYPSWHYEGPGEQYDDSITLNNVNIVPYTDVNSYLYFTVPELPADTVLGYNDTVKLYYHNPNLRRCVSTDVFEYRNTLISGIHFLLLTCNGTTFERLHVGSVR